MANYGSNSVVVTFGGTNMTQHTQKINGIKISSILEQSTSFGDAWMESLATGMKKGEPVVLEGLYDDTATTGPDAKYSVTASGPGTTPTALVITYGGSKTTSYNVLIQDYERQLVVGSLHRYKVTLVPTGQISEA